MGWEDDIPKWQVKNVPPIVDQQCVWCGMQPLMTRLACGKQEARLQHDRGPTSVKNWVKQMTGVCMLQYDLLCSWADKICTISSRRHCCAEAAHPLSGARTTFCPSTLDLMQVVGSLADRKAKIRSSATAGGGVNKREELGEAVYGVCTQVVGSLADRKARPGKPLAGLLVQQGQSCMLMAPEDLPTFTMLHPGRIIQRQVLSLNQPWTEVRLCSETFNLFLVGVQCSAVPA